MATFWPSHLFADKDHISFHLGEQISGFLRGRGDAGPLDLAVSDEVLFGPIPVLIQKGEHAVFDFPVRFVAPLGQDSQLLAGEPIHEDDGSFGSFQGEFLVMGLLAP